MRPERIYDVTHTINSKLPVYPGDPVFSMSVLKSLDKGDPCNLSVLTLGAHTGTHLDAPAHFINEGERIHDIPMERLILPVSLVDTGHIVEESDLLQLEPPSQGVIFRTGSYEGYISEGAARACVSRRLKLVGIDALSVDSLESTAVHKILLSNSILILEGLYLKDVPAGLYTLLCMPLKIEDAEASPVRAILAPADWYK